MLAHAALLGFALLMLLAAWTDARAYTIPNWISGAIIALWPLGAFALGLTWAEAGMSLLTGLAVLAVMIGLWAPGWIGGGDAKLIAAGALWFGWPGAVTFILLAGVCGGVLALALVLARRFAPAMPGMKAEWMADGVLAQGSPAPYGIAIAAGALWAIPFTLAA
ncbi:pilus assembly protein CpaA [Glycocaulis profundi]|nr:pilus assembly protein CpaA [Glycocaulis profundi]